MSTSNNALAFRNVPLGRGRDLYRLMDTLKDEAAIELAAAVSGVSIRRIVAADVPGASAYGLSRAINGNDSNPLFRLIGIFVLMRKLGLRRERALRILAWLREVVDALWPEDEAKKEGSPPLIGRADESRP